MKITLVQANLIWEDTQANLDKFDILLSDLSKDTEIVILPEMFSTGFTMNINNLAKPTGKQVFDWLQQKASAIDKIIVGSILIEENDKYYNRMYWMRPDGSFDYYDKRHLFHQGGEDKVMTAGDRRVVLNHKGVKFMLQICYDLRFPVAVKNNYDKETDTYDYDAIIYIANWPEVRKLAYLSLLKARAIENQAYVIWVNRIGEDDKNMAHIGDSQLLDAHGNIVASCLPNEESLLDFEISIDALYQFRKQFKVGLDWDKFELRQFL